MNRLRILTENSNIINEGVHKRFVYDYDRFYSRCWEYDLLEMESYDFDNEDYHVSLFIRHIFFFETIGVHVVNLKSGEETRIVKKRIHTKGRLILPNDPSVDNETDIKSRESRIRFTNKNNKSTLIFEAYREGFKIRLDFENDFLDDALVSHSSFKKSTKRFALSYLKDLKNISMTLIDSGESINSLFNTGYYSFERSYIPSGSSVSNSVIRLSSDETLLIRRIGDKETHVFTLLNGEKSILNPELSIKLEPEKPNSKVLIDSESIHLELLPFHRIMETESGIGLMAQESTIVYGMNGYYIKDENKTTIKNGVCSVKTISIKEKYGKRTTKQSD